MNLSRSLLMLLLVMGCAWCATANTAIAEDDDAIIRVEEDWELNIKTPDENSAGPQVVTAISPGNDVDWYHATLELNHQSLPEYAEGGIRLQAWCGDRWIEAQEFPDANVLQYNNEVIRWTQSMTLNNGIVTFEVFNGNSKTWGTFGGQGHLKWSIGTDLSGLNNYSPKVSAQNSGVTFGANLVKSLVLKKVRVYTSDDEMTELSDSITLHPAN